MTDKDLAVLQSNILETYFADNARKLHKTVSKILFQFGGVSNKGMDDFYSLANEVFVDVLKRYDYVQSFDAFLYSCLTNKIKTEITKRNREKRRADRMSISLDVVNENDESGNVKRDAKGEIVWESVEYDIRNKTYEQLPEELKDRFDGYQMDVAIHQDCDTTEISKLVRIYNNHKSVNQAQRAFTYVDAFAREIRTITKNRFFLDLYTCSQKERINGTLERVVGDMMILCNYPDHYRKDSKQAFKWLNENAAIYDFESLSSLLTRLTASIKPTEEVKKLFSSKNAYIFVAAFKAFTESGRKDAEYSAFLEWFINSGSRTEINKKTWDGLNITDKSTRDTSIVHGKLDYLLELIKWYSIKTRKAA